MIIHCWTLVYWAKIHITMTTPQHPEYNLTHSRHIKEKLTLLALRPEYTWWTKSISWQLMPRLLESPGHQQPWYWSSDMRMFLSSLTVNLSNLLWLTLNMLIHFKNDKIFIHISYHVWDFIWQTKPNSQWSKSTCCLSYSVNTMPADALALK